MQKGLCVSTRARFHVRVYMYVCMCMCGCLLKSAPCDCRGMRRRNPRPRLNLRGNAITAASEGTVRRILDEHAAGRWLELDGNPVCSLFPPDVVPKQVLLLCKTAITGTEIRAHRKR